jgi:hypothetical protein
MMEVGEVDIECLRDRLGGAGQDDDSAMGCVVRDGEIVGCREFSDACDVGGVCAVLRLKFFVSKVLRAL